jgi:hypothetical protein
MAWQVTPYSDRRGTLFTFEELRPLVAWDALPKTAPEFRNSVGVANVHLPADLPLGISFT